MHCFTRLQEGIAVLLSVCMHWILAFGDCFTISSLILHGICLQKMHHFGWFSVSARWQTSFNFNHTMDAGTLPSTGHFRPTAQWLLYLPCAPEEEKFCSSILKSHANRAATRNWPIKLNQQYLEVMTDYLNNVEGEYQLLRHTKNPTRRSSEKPRDFKTFSSFSIWRKWQNWLPLWCYLSYT